MPSRQTQMRDLHPQPPEDLIRELLALSHAQILPLAPGDAQACPCGEGEYLLTAAVQGNLTVASHEQYALLSQGQAMALGMPGVYTIQAVSGCLCMTITLSGELAGRLLQEQLAEGRLLFPQGAPAIRTAVLALAVLEDERGQVDGALASSYAYTLLLGLHAAAKEPGQGTGRFSPLVESAVAVIQEEFPYLAGLDELAERLEVSKVHLIRTFTKAVGISPGKYLTRVRVEYAKLLLGDEGVSITYVAEASGFANANYFAKVFRRETGMSPSEYLESAPPQKRAGLQPGRVAPPW